MPLLDVTARAHPDGHRIDLTWRHPDGAPADAGVRVVRRERTHPVAPDDGVVVADAPGLTTVADTGLHGETTYYYALFAFAGTPRAVEPPVLAGATATARYDLAGLMYTLLPGLYRRYDVAPAVGAPEQLRRFLALPGAQLDQIYSLVTAALTLHDVDRVDGALLPLLAEWIGWRTDRSLPVGARRAEIAHAPPLYRSVGAAAAVDSAVARVLGLPSRTKEYVHNVARTTTPEQLTLWSTRRPAADAAWTPPELLSVEVAHDGRATHVRDAAGAGTLVFHARRAHAGGIAWEIRAKQRQVDGGWSTSAPVADRLGVDKNPTAAAQGDLVRLFWEVGDAPAGPAGPPRWRLATAERAGGTWSPSTVLRDDGVLRRTPAAAADGQGGVWLFRRERGAAGWAVRYDRHDGTAWAPDPAATVPDPVGPGVPPVEDDLAVVIDPGRPRPLWLFWSGRVPDGPAGAPRWRIGWRTKASLDPTADDWSAAGVVPAEADGHDREPAAVLTDAGAELFWASTRGGGWAVHRAAVDVTADPVWSSADVVAPSPYTQRSPLVVDAAADGVTGVVFRSNRSVASVVGLAGDPDAPRTLDARYAGTTTVRSSDAAKRALAGRFEDFQTYLHAGGRVARDVVGVFVRPPAGGPALGPAAAARLTAVLPEFLPVSLRAVVIPDE